MKVWTVVFLPASAAALPQLGHISREAFHKTVKSGPETPLPHPLDGFAHIRTQPPTGGSGGTPTHISQHDMHDALIVLRAVSGGRALSKRGPIRVAGSSHC